jgi:enediyne polyketide synthase
LPDEFVLGDPAARDTVIHSIQGCIPHGTLLPVRVDRIVTSGTAATLAVMYAKERSQDGDRFIYDLEVAGPDGTIVETWEGLELRRVSQTAPDRSWPESLLGPYLERRLAEVLGDADASIVVERRGGGDRRAGSDRAIQRAVAADVEIHRRPDGKPEAGSGREVSVSHAGDLIMAVAAESRVAGDVEPVIDRPEASWQDLLGADRFVLARTIANQTGEDRHTAATRVWSAQECLVKAGVNPDAPLVFDSATQDGWVQLTAGSLRVATAVLPVRGEPNQVAFAVCLEACRASV